MMIFILIDVDIGNRILYINGLPGNTASRWFQREWLNRDQDGETKALCALEIIVPRDTFDLLYDKPYLMLKNHWKAIKPMLKMELLAMNEFQIIISCQERIENSFIQEFTDKKFGRRGLPGISIFNPERLLLGRRLRFRTVLDQKWRSGNKGQGL